MPYGVKLGAVQVNGNAPRGQGYTGIVKVRRCLLIARHSDRRPVILDPGRTEPGPGGGLVMADRTRSESSKLDEPREDVSL
jgi:hypothetical protein